MTEPCSHMRYHTYPNLEVAWVHNNAILCGYPIPKGYEEVRDLVVCDSCGEHWWKKVEVDFPT